MSPPSPATRVDRDRVWLIVAVVTWCATFVVVSAVMRYATTYNTITYDVYVAAVRHWWSRAPLYDLRTVDDFQYLPHAAWLFSPFVYLGEPTGGLAWRALCWGLCAHGVWRVARLLAPAQIGKVFLIVTALTIPPSVNGLGIGQANLLVAALTLQVTADLIERHFWRATALLMLGLAAKPLMAVLLLLVWALYRPMRWRVPIASGVLFATPFVAANAAYVIEQYAEFLTKSRMTANPHRLFEDANGLLTSVGLVLPYAAWLALRLIAALVTLGLCARAKQVFREPRSTLYIAALAVTYLMLFNPRTQSNSYAIATPIVALFAATYVLERRAWAAAATTVIVLCWSGNSHHMVWPEYWLKPLACVVFAALLTWEVSRTRVRSASTSERRRPLGLNRRRPRRAACRVRPRPS